LNISGQLAPLKAKLFLRGFTAAALLYQKNRREYPLNFITNITDNNKIVKGRGVGYNKNNNQDTNSKKQKFGNCNLVIGH
jgi:hypothetical protein